MKLKLVKQGEFLGTKCDFYTNEKNNIFMSRTQIGYALQYTNPHKAIATLHERNLQLLNGKFIEQPILNLMGGSVHLDKNATMIMYNEQGIFSIVRKAKTKVADEYFDWVYDVIQNIKKNGYYISTQKDEKWLGIREDSKSTRKEETDEIKLFVDYAKSNGSSKPEKYYIHFTNLARKKLNIPKDLKRDNMTQKQLRDIMALETIISLKIPKLIDKNVEYHEAYKKIKQLIEII